LKLDFSVTYDEKDAIGKRYRRQDAVGTPFCITIDHDSLEDNTVTIRNRDTMTQERIPVDKVAEVLRKEASISSVLKDIID
jgi:glycyl-tRNA synthetase